MSSELYTSIWSKQWIKDNFEQYTQNNIQKNLYSIKALGYFLGSNYQALVGKSILYFLSTSMLKLPSFYYDFCVQNAEFFSAFIAESVITFYLFWSSKQSFYVKNRTTFILRLFVAHFISTLFALNRIIIIILDEESN